MPAYCTRINKLNHKTQRTELNVTHPQRYTIVIITYTVVGIAIAVSIITVDKIKEADGQNT